MPSDKQDDSLVTYSIPVQDQQWFLSELARIMYPAGTVAALRGNLNTEYVRSNDLYEMMKKMQARAAPAEGAFTDPLIFDARCAKEELKYALEGLAFAIWEEAKKLVETA